MKALKITGIVLLGLLLLGVIIGFMLPSKVHIERKALIEASPSVLFSQTNNLKNWNNWSPWYFKDPEAKVVYSGPEAGVGASSAWDSQNKEVGKGSMEITESVPDQKMVVKMDFMEGNFATATFDFVPSGENTEVIWSFDADMGYNLPGRWISFLMMESWLGPDFEDGLARLKKFVESTPAFTIEEKERAAFEYIAIKATVSAAQIGDKMGELMGRLVEFAGKNKVEITGPPFARYFSFSEEKVDMQVCFPVAKTVKPSGDITSEKMPAGMNAEVDYFGNYDGSMYAHTAMDNWLKANNKQASDAPYEIYFTDPAAEADTSKWHLKVCYPIN